MRPARTCGANAEPGNVIGAGRVIGGEAGGPNHAMGPPNTNADGARRDWRSNVPMVEELRGKVPA